MEVSFLSNYNIPFSDLVRNFFARRPKDVDGVANTSSLYYRDFLLRKVFGRFEFTGWPRDWPEQDYAMTHLFLDGYFAIVDPGTGPLPLECGFSGNNVFNRPTTIRIANHVLGTFDREIGIDGALVRLQYNYHGIEVMIQRYATLLAMADSSIAVNLMNAKVAFVSFAETKAQGETFKKMFDMISMGEPAVFLKGDPTMRDQFMFNNVKQNFVGDQVNDLKSRIVDEFLTEIGILSTNTEKKERLITTEAESRRQEVGSNVEHWLRTVRKTLGTANEIFNLDLGFRLIDLDRGADHEGGEDDELPESS